MSDSSDIDAAIVVKLSSDTTLLSLCPNGVYFDEAPAGATRFVIVSLVDEADVQEQGRRSHEDALYQVEARMLSTVTNANPKAAAARIADLLEDQPLIVAGYKWMTTYRESRIRVTEEDGQDTSLRWFRRGGNYRIMMSTA